MRIGFVVFNGITFLDFIGFYDVVNRLNWFEETKGTTWDICGLSEEISDESGLTIKSTGLSPTCLNMIYCLFREVWERENFASMGNVFHGCGKPVKSNTSCPFVPARSCSELQVF